MSATMPSWTGKAAVTAARATRKVAKAKVAKAKAAAAARAEVETREDLTTVELFLAVPSECQEDN